MPREVTSLYSLNRGVVSRYGLARLDVKRLALAAETQTNWMPRVLGGMMLRPGLQYKGATASNAAARYLPFVFSTSDTALVELTASAMRIWINDSLLTRPSVSTTISDSALTTGVGWTDLDEAGATSTIAGGVMILAGTGTARAIREQTLTIAAGDQNVEHALRITVGDPASYAARGPLMLRIGSSSGGEQYVAETSLDPGVHSISFTPTGASVYLRFFSASDTAPVLTDISVESAGVVSIPTPWGASDLDNVRYDQSGDVIYVACKDIQQYKIERRGTRPNARSWSVAMYQTSYGPFLVQNTGPITLTPGALSGSVTFTASQPIFNVNHENSIWSITSPGQNVSTTSAVSGTPTSSIRVTGITGARSFSIIISGIAAASTVDLQRSYDDATWVNVAGQTWTANVTTTYTDGLDNQIVYYRLNLTTRVAPDTVTMNLVYSGGSVRGIFRISGYSGPTIVTGVVLNGVRLGSLQATTNWQEGKWSDYRGYPTAVRFHEGRLWWAGLNGVVGSASDAFDVFDETQEGDAAYIDRTIGSGPVDTINWILSLKGLVLGAQGTEFTARASSLEEPLTVANFNLKGSSNQGSGAVNAVKVDRTGYFVNRSRVKVFALDFDARTYDYGSNCAMELCPEIGYPGIVRMDVQRLPDTRLHCVLSDGTAAVMIINQNEEVAAWVKVETDGDIEDVVVLPAADGTLDDQVYYVVNRTINGSTVRYLEKWAQEVDCRGDKQYCYLADSFYHYSGAATTTITGLSHLEGENVVVWADGLDVGTNDATDPWTQTYTVSGGQIVLATAASNVVVGLGYTGTFKSTKLGSNMQGVSALNQQKKISHIGLVLADVYDKGLKFGPSSDYLDDMPSMEEGTTVADGTRSTYDEQMIEFPGSWNTDSRVYLQAQAPRPCTVLAVTIDQVQA